MKAYLLLLILVTSCVAPFEPEVERYEDLLVVEGLLSNLEGPHYLKLSKSVSLINDSSGFAPVTSAEVIIESDGGDSFELTQYEPGAYGIKGAIGVIGQSYRCIITLQDGTIYQSDYQELSEPTEIDSVYFELENINDVKNSQYVHFFVDSKQAKSSPYLRWDYVEDWIYRAPYQPQFALSPEGEWTEATVESICYSNRNGSEITMGSTLTNAGGKIVNKRITSVSNQTTKLRYGYLINIKQYSVTKQTYDFWRKLGESNQDLGTLFDVQPGVLPTNLKTLNERNPQPVIGLFEVSSAVERTLFVDHTDIDGLTTINSGSTSCAIYEYMIASYPSRAEFDAAMSDILKSGDIVFLDLIEIADGPSSIILGYRLIKTNCTDCEIYGNGTKTKPADWPM